MLVSLSGCALSANLNGRSFWYVRKSSIRSVGRRCSSGDAGPRWQDARPSRSRFCAARASTSGFDSSNDPTCAVRVRLTRWCPRARSASTRRCRARRCHRRRCASSVTIEHDRYEGGRWPRPWRRMPALAGMTLEVARTALVRAQLPIDTNFKVVLIETEGCAPGTMSRDQPRGEHSEDGWRPAAASTSARRAPPRRRRLGRPRRPRKPSRAPQHLNRPRNPTSTSEDPYAAAPRAPPRAVWLASTTFPRDDNYISPSSMVERVEASG